MKIKFSRTTVLVLACIFCAILCLGGILGFHYWKEHLAIGLSYDTEYVLDGTDLTNVIQYATVTNSFVMGVIFTFYGVFLGFVLDTVILSFYTLIKLIKDNTAYFRERAEENRLYKEELRERIEKRNAQLKEWADEPDEEKKKSKPTKKKTKK